MADHDLPDITAVDSRDEIITYLPALRAFAISLTRTGSAADDLVQDTIVKAWSNIHRFEPGTNMRAWLFTILRNTFYSDCRRSRWVVSDTDGVAAAGLAEKPAHDGRLQMRDFQLAFAALPPEQREALILVGASGFSYEEAARMCGCAIGTIKSRINRGRRRLVAQMSIDEREPFELTDRATVAVIASSNRSIL